MIRKPLLLSVLIALAGILAGCHRQYRLLDADLKPFKALPPRSQVVLPLAAEEHNPGFNEVYIEFDDQGKMFDRPVPYQLRMAEDLIAKKKPENVVLYVHGWNNNASENSADVTRFRFALSYLAATHAKGESLVGIFIGWRGGTLKGGILGPFTFMTYWSRKEGARRMGTGELTSVIDDLVAKSKEAQPRRRFYAMGHSFGARVLEGALQDSSHIKAFLTALDQHQDHVELPIDLVLLINPATDSALTRRLLRKADKLNTEQLVIRHPQYNEATCHTHPELRICQPYPLMVEMSSRGDIPTGFAMPAANFFNWIPPFLFMAHPSARLASAPFSPGLHTHEVVSCGFGEAGCKADQNTEFTFAMPASPRKQGSSTLSDDPDTFLWEKVERLPHPSSPFIWDFTVDREISRNHGDVWNANVAALLFALTDPQQRTEYPVTITNPAPASGSEAVVPESPAGPPPAVAPSPATPDHRRPMMTK